ncbi:YfiT family bacillithiol transferase [Cohnella abietis]|nr:putative metal-dependent hydrolase [Cohnella abietis]
MEAILKQWKGKGTRNLSVVDERYPIGRFTYEGKISADQRMQWIADISLLPTQLSTALEGLSEEQLDTPYRTYGWTVRQVAHHIADSHLNSFTRFKLALTEKQPTIKPYYEEQWALLPDSKQAPVVLSIALVTALHARWDYLLQAMREEDFARTFRHPESLKVLRLDEALGIYSWHGRHHVAHITSLRGRMGW